MTAPLGSLLVRLLERACDPEAAFCELYADSVTAVWLDSSLSGDGTRFSFLGDASGPLGARLSYRSAEREVRIERRGGGEVFSGSIFEYLERELAASAPPGPRLPFGFRCGFAGYLGYELKAECEGEAAHTSPHPDASFALLDRLIAVDHLERRTYVLALARPGEEPEAETWLRRTCGRLGSLPSPRPAEPPPPPQPGRPVELSLERSRERYRRDVERCRERLIAGESYEICLTNRAAAAPVGDPLGVYRRLRRANPAPFAAYLRFGELAVLSSSPERFLRIEPDGRVEAKPIKGTMRRGTDRAEDARLAGALQTEAKFRAENVTIVDLLRNDLGKVCEYGSVSAAALFEVESYATVHQLVSTVRGKLRPGASALDCVRACFPPGSMTGAPKRRTMAILDELEGSARGVYSGAIGYLGLGGAADLSVAIRTIVCDGEATTVGAGGAIVLDSDPGRELEEMQLKLEAPARALGATLRAGSGQRPRALA
jgi:para-aminobenzoate synthetase